MALARILAVRPRDAADFARQLQDSGFQVEIVGPNQQPLAPADLEIEFAICDHHEVLRRAVAIAEQLHSEVVVFPGAVQAPQPVFEVPEVLEGDPEPAMYEQSGDPHQAGPGEPGRDRVDAVILPEPAQEHRILGTPLPPAEMPLAWEDAGEPTEIFQEDRVVVPDQPLPAASQQPVLSEETLAPQGPSIFERLADGLRTALTDGAAKLKKAAGSASATVITQTHAISAGIKLRSAQARQAWEERLREVKQRRLEAAQRRTLLAQERQKQAELAAVAGEQRPVLEPVQENEIERLRAEKQRLLAEIEYLQAALRQAQWTAAKPKLGKFIKLIRRPSGPLRGAIAGGLAAVLLFLAGIVLANFQAVTPVSSQLGNGVEEQTPFGPATVHGSPGVTVGGPPPSKSAPLAQAPQQSNLQPAPRASSTKRPAQRRHFQRRASRTQNDATAGDVIVRHFRQTAKPASTTQQQARLKHYSDE